MVGDVVTALDAHQQNLRPRPAPEPPRILALPPPRLAARLGGDALRTARLDALDELATRIGGGNGAARIEDLAPETTDLLAVLDALPEGRPLVIWGAFEQPGLAREVLFRWNGEVTCPDLGVGRWLHLDSSSPLEIEEPHVRGPDQRGPFGGVLPAAGRAGSPRGAHLRTVWTAHWQDPDLVRGAALGLDPDLDARLWRNAPVPPRPEAPPILAVTGIDGSGKSTHAAALQTHLVDRGLRVGRIKLYRHGPFLALADELGARTRRGAPLANFRASRVVKLVDSLRVALDVLHPVRASVDVVVADRYVETHVAAARSQLGWEVEDHPLLGAFPQPLRQFWLRLPVERAIARLEARSETLTADEHAVGLRGYAEAFDALAHREVDHVLDATAPFAANASTLAREVDTLLSSPCSGQGAALDLVGPTPPVRQGCTTLHVGRCGLGQSVVTLRERFLDLHPELARRVPIGTWIEAWCAQVVIDLWREAPEDAAVALWPAALAAMPELQDLTVLVELQRLIDASTRPGVFARPRPGDAAWQTLASWTGGDVAAARVFSSYQRAFDATLARGVALSTVPW